MPSDTFRRLLAGLAGLSVPFVAGFLQRFGINIPTEQLVGAEVGAALYIGQSVINAMHARSVASVGAPTPAAAVADLNKGPQP